TARLEHARANRRQARLDNERLQKIYEEDLIARVRTERASVNLSDTPSNDPGAIAFGRGAGYRRRAATAEYRMGGLAGGSSHLPRRADRRAGGEKPG
ncbi:MAG: hypothetical protein ABR522_03365, partial [Marinobacter sp.]